MTVKTLTVSGLNVAAQVLGGTGLTSSTTNGVTTLSVSGSQSFSGNVGIGTASPRNVLELSASTVATSSSTTLRIGGVVGTYTPGNYTAIGQEINRHGLVFSSWRDAQTDTIGAKIEAINYTNYNVASNYHLTQRTDIVFSTLNTLASGTDSTTEKMRITAAGKVLVNLTTDYGPNMYIYGGLADSTTSYGLVVNTPKPALTAGSYSNMAYFANNRSSMNDGLRIVNYRASTAANVGEWQTEDFRIMRDVDQNGFTGSAQCSIVWGNSTLNLMTAGGSRLYITSAGNVGIGTTSPTEFQVYRANAGGNLLAVFENSSAVSSSSAIVQVRTNASNGYAALDLCSDSANYIFFQKQNGTDDARITGNGATIYFAVTSSITEKMRINNTGVGIGSISPSYSLHLAADSAAKPTSNTWTISSDARVKEVIGSYTRGVADIVALEPKRYRLNGAFGSVDDGRVHVSVIAQEAQVTWPEMIGTYEHTDKDEDGVETVTELLNLNTNELQWALVNAIKELSQRIEALEAGARR